MSFLIEDEVLETDVLEAKTDNFDFNIPTESKSAAKKAEKNFFDGLDADEFDVIGVKKTPSKKETDFFAQVGGVGLTKGLDFFNLDKENPDWENERINLASDEDLLFSKFFMEGEQNEALREYRKNKKDDDSDDDDSDD